MFTKEFDHSKQDIKEACGFTSEEYVNSVVEALLKIYNDASKYSMFVQAAEEQIIGKENIPLSVIKAIRILLMLSIPQLKTISQVKEVSITTVGGLKELRKELRSRLREIMEDEDFDTEKEIERFADSLKVMGLDNNAEELAKVKEFIKKELKDIKES